MDNFVDREKVDRLPAATRDWITNVDTRPAPGWRQATLTTIGYDCAEAGFTNDEILLLLQELGLRWGKYRTDKPFKQFTELMRILRRAREKYPNGPDGLGHQADTGTNTDENPDAPWPAAGYPGGPVQTDFGLLPGCRRGVCTHSAFMHDVEDDLDPVPLCGAPGCECGRLTPYIVRVFPEYYIKGPGYERASEAKCDHGHRLTDSCPGCDGDPLLQSASRVGE